MKDYIQFINNNKTKIIFLKTAIALIIKTNNQQIKINQIKLKK
jgi:hypothetical protein